MKVADGYPCMVNGIFNRVQLNVKEDKSVIRNASPIPGFLEDGKVNP